MGEEKLLEEGVKLMYVKQYKGFETCCEMLQYNHDNMIGLHVLGFIMCLYRELNGAPSKGLGHISKFLEVWISFGNMFL